MGAGPGKTTGWVHRIELKRNGVKMLAGVEYVKVDDAGLHIRVDGRDEVLPVDHVILCAGQEPVRELAPARRRRRRLRRTSTSSAAPTSPPSSTPSARSGRAPNSRRGCSGRRQRPSPAPRAIAPGRGPRPHHASHRHGRTRRPPPYPHLQERSTMPTIDTAALHQLFLDARTQNGWRDEPVTDAELEHLFDLMKMGPTSANCSPGPVPLRALAGGEGAAVALHGARQRREDAHRAGHRDHRLRPRVLRQAAAALPAHRRAQLVRRQARSHRQRGVPQRLAAGGLPDPRRARDRPRLRPDVRLRQRQGRCRVLGRHRGQDQLHLQPRPRRPVEAACRAAPGFRFDEACRIL